jgi:ATP-dependent 26S proteasome regulatory subunit
MIRIDVVNGRDIYLAPESDERIFLPASMITDIERQVISFFQDPKAFAKFNIAYRRGLLFVGTPGGGKTMMIRHLIRLCHKSFKSEFLSINIKRTTNEDEIVAFFERAARKAPCMVILEDLDSLTKEASISRSALLNQLDGLKPRKGLLVIGTTNNPVDIDPALIHRPSRFDRVWIFEMPDKKLRQEYLESSLPGADPALILDIAGKTADWSFAYLNELRTTASILAIQEGSECVTEKQIEQAFVLMTAQFKSNKNGHKGKVQQKGMGFEAS